MSNPIEELRNQLSVSKEAQKAKPDKTKEGFYLWIHTKHNVTESMFKNDLLNDDKVRLELEYLNYVSSNMHANKVESYLEDSTAVVNFALTPDSSRDLKLNNFVIFILERLESCIFDPKADDLRNEVINYIDHLGFIPLTKLEDVLLKQDPRITFIRFERDLLSGHNSNIQDHGSLSDLSTCVHAVLVDVVSDLVKSDVKVFSEGSRDIAKDVLKGTKYEVLFNRVDQ